MAKRSPSTLGQICLRRVREMTKTMYNQSVGLCAGSWNPRDPYQYPLMRDDFLRAQLRYASRLYDETVWEQQFHCFLSLQALCDLNESDMFKVLEVFPKHRRMFSKHIEDGRIVLVSQPRPAPAKFVAKRFFDRMRSQVHGPNCRCYNSPLKRRYLMDDEVMDLCDK